MDVGSLVKCIKGPTRGFWVDDFGNKLYAPSPVIGYIYTIRGFTKNDGILLEEINGPMAYFHGVFAEAGYYRQRFVELLPPMMIDISELQHQTQVV